MSNTPSPLRFAVLINFIVSLVEGLLSLRIVLKIFAASPTAPFVRWVYMVSEPLLRPFAGMLPSPRLTGGFIVEFPAVFALIAYAFVGYLAIELLEALARQTVKRDRDDD